MTAEPQEPVVVPYGQLSDLALRGVVEAFVLREGTDYGAREFTLDEKIAHVMNQLMRHEAELMFDPDSGSVGIVRVASHIKRSTKALPDRSR
ncbi:MAG: YheU family protein [Gammaproteobacteria bacterium]|nr:YheU family protein [Gammaproteobacteria bacterium]